MERTTEGSMKEQRGPDLICNGKEKRGPDHPCRKQKQKDPESRPPLPEIETENARPPLQTTSGVKRIRIPLKGPTGTERARPQLQGTRKEKVKVMLKLVPSCCVYPRLMVRSALQQEQGCGLFLLTGVSSTSPCW